MLAGALTGILMMLGILKVAVILAGILMLARILTLVGAFIRDPIPDGTLILEEIETSLRMERQPRRELETSENGTLTGIPMPAGTLTSPEIGTSDGTERQPGTEPRPLVAERRSGKGSYIRDGNGEIDHTSEIKNYGVV